MHDIFNALAVLTPRDNDISKRSSDSQGDGVYAVAENFRSGQSIISLGVDPETSVEFEPAKAVFRVRQFDRIVHHKSMPHPRITFTPERASVTALPDSANWNSDKYASNARPVVTIDDVVTPTVLEIRVRGKSSHTSFLAKFDATNA